jgi:hypothetical protein
MPVIVASLLGGLINIASTLVGRVLVSLGIAVVTYSGVSVTLEWLRVGAITSFSGLPANVLGIMALLKVGECISMVFSAITVKLTLDGLTGGTIKRWIKT